MNCDGSKFVHMKCDDTNRVVFLVDLRTFNTTVKAVLINSNSRICY